MAIEKKALEKRKEQILAQFESHKKIAVAHEAVIVERQREIAKIKEEMVRLQGEHRLIDELLKTA